VALPLPKRSCAPWCWPQNNWLDVEPYWRGVQLDETAFPVLLAYRLKETAADRAVDLWAIVRKAAAFLARAGPVTQEERWAEDGGYSPSTLATCIAALVCAADVARAAGEPKLGAYLEEVADWWAGQLDFWTFTCEGDLVPGHPEHYVRLGVPQDGHDDGRRSNGATVIIHNLSPGAVDEFPTRDVVDTGFLELVRHGVRPANDRSVVVSLPVVDATLKVELPCGPCWHRYNHDGYGEREDGSPFVGWGSGRPWPLLTGERAHYELAAGNVAEARRLARAMECFANEGGLLSEQVWDGQDIPDRELTTGRPSGSATPLLWAHAEYLRLLRSLADGQVFDLLAPVANRYKGGPPRARAVWRFNHKLRTVARGGQLRIEVLPPAWVHGSADQWQNVRDAPAIATNPEAMVASNAKAIYEWMVSDDEPEGTHYFHSHGDDRDQTNHGLFGALIVERKGSTYLDPIHGGALRSGWSALRAVRSRSAGRCRSSATRIRPDFITAHSASTPSALWSSNVSTGVPSCGAVASSRAATTSVTASACVNVYRPPAELTAGRSPMVSTTCRHRATTDVTSPGTVSGARPLFVAAVTTASIHPVGATREPDTPAGGVPEALGSEARRTCPCPAGRPGSPGFGGACGVSAALRDR